MTDQNHIKILSNEDVRMSYAVGGGAVRVAEFNRWLKSVQEEAYKAGAEDALEEADMNMRMVGY
jgi:methanogenic corrinoid protein MtbC1